MVLTTWSSADEFIRAEAEARIWAGDAPRSTLVMFEGELTTLVATSGDDEPCDMTAMVELVTLARVLCPDRFVLSTPLPPEPDAEEGGEVLTVEAITATPALLLARASRGTPRPQIRAEALPYGRRDDGSPVWRKRHRLRLRRRRPLRGLLVDAVTGASRASLPGPRVVAAYLLEAGHRIATAEGWAERYGLDWP